MNRNLIVLLASVLIVACHTNPLKINVSNIALKAEVKHLDEDLFAAKEHFTKKLPSVEEKYKEFFTIFTYQMIRIGGKDSVSYLPQLNSFLNDSVIIDAKNQVDQLIDRNKLEEDFTQALKHYNYYFPQKTVPSVYTCVSGFNQSVVVSLDLIGVSLDKYLGDKCQYYKQLGLAEYKIRNMHPGKIVPDAMYAWGLTEYPISSKADKLIEHMIYKGKMMYFVDAMMPELADTIKIGFSKMQLEFCEISEQGMWTFLAEQNMLFSTKRMDIKRYVDDGPYTSSFTADSPGRVGVWLGWQIVKAYMKKNPDVTLAQLMVNEDYMGILNHSGYSPG